MVVAEFIIMHLTAREAETLAECHNEVLDIMDDLILNYSLVDVFFPLSQLLHIDEIKQVFILEHLDGFESLLMARDGLDEVIGHLALVVEGIFCDAFLNAIHTEFLIVAYLDVVLPFLHRLGASQDGGMVGETDAQESDNGESGIICQL